MAIAPFAEFRPDLSSINKSYTDSVLNVLPRADGYGPMMGPDAFSAALGDTCRGYFQANYGNTIAIFAATETRVYLLDNATLTWTDVSKGATDYAGINSDAQWQFGQFNNFVFAVQQNVAPQVYDLSSSSAFADLAGSPPQAGGIAIVNRFVVLFDLTNNPTRVQWSGLNATTTWTAGTTYSGSQDLPDGGRVRGVAGGEFGVILQDRAMRRMIFVPGSPIVFQIERIASDRGLFAPYSLCQGGERIFFLSSNGFVQMTGDGGATPIGFERVDRTIFADIDQANLQLCIGSVDPQRYLVIFAYKSQAGNVGRFDKALAYNWQLERWSPLELDGQYIANTGVPALTLEGVDLIAPGYTLVTDTADNGSGLVRLEVGDSSHWETGDFIDVIDVGGTTEANGNWEIEVIDATHIDLVGSAYANAYTSGGYVAGDVDALEVSLDSFTTIPTPKLTMFNSSNELCFFTGEHLEATMETAETLGTRTRVDVNGGQPITDAPDCYLSVGGRDVLNGALTYGDESQIDADGYCPVLENVRSGRMKLRIPAGEIWTFASGVDPEVAPAGRF